MPNTDYLINQRKLKRIKNEATYLTNTNSNSYSMMNMSSILNNNNNIQANSQIYSAHAYSSQHNFSVGDSNSMTATNYYSNSYYDWSSPSNCTQLNSRNSQMISQSFTNNNNNSSSVENTLETGVRDLIKIIYQSFQVYLNPLLHLLKEELNKNSNQYNYQHRLASNQYQASIEKKNLREIMDYLRFYARKFANFSENIPGK